jgi:hypothetical protein
LKEAEEYALRECASYPTQILPQLSLMEIYALRGRQDKLPDLALNIDAILKLRGLERSDIPVIQKNPTTTSTSPERKTPVNAIDFVAHVAGNPLQGAVCAAFAALACFGAGRALLAAGRFETRDRAIRNIAAFAIGMDVFALLVSLLYFTGVKGLAAWTAIALAAPAAAWGATRALKELPGIASGVKRRPLTTALLCVAPAIYLGAALCPPAGWDELVYQLAAPRRWLLDGLPLCYADLPYSAFPSLPQTLYWPLMLMGDAMAAKLFAFAVFIAMLPATYRLCRLKASPLLAAVATFAVALTPVSSFLVKETYAEQFIALNLLAAVLLSFDGRPERPRRRRSAASCWELRGGQAVGAFIGPAFLLFFHLQTPELAKDLDSADIRGGALRGAILPATLDGDGESRPALFRVVFKRATRPRGDGGLPSRNRFGAFRGRRSPGLLLSPLMLGVR